MRLDGVLPLGLQVAERVYLVFHPFAELGVVSYSTGREVDSIKGVLVVVEGSEMGRSEEDLAAIPDAQDRHAQVAELASESLFLQQVGQGVGFFLHGLLDQGHVHVVCLAL